MTKTLISLLIGAVVGAGAVLVVTQQGGASLLSSGPSAVALKFGKAHTGEITKNNYLNVVDGSRSQLFRVGAKEGQLMQINVRGALNSRVSVLNNNFLVTDSSQQGAQDICGTSAQPIKRNQFYFTADKAGDYDVAVSGATASDYGPYEVEVNTIDVPTVGTETLVIDAPLERIATGKTKSYTFTADTQGLYVFDMVSCDFDGILTLTGNGVNATDDDGGENYDPRLKVWLEPGQYTLVADSNGNTASTMFGKYTLKASKQAMPTNHPVQNGGELQAGKTITSIFNSNSSRGQEYTFTLSQRSLVVLTARSDTIDTTLEVSGNDESWSDDDSGNGVNGTDAQIREVLPAGTYAVTIGSYGSSNGYATVSLAVTPR